MKNKNILREAGVLIVAAIFVLTALVIAPIVSAELWDYEFTINTGEQSGSLYLVGVAFDGEYFYQCEFSKNKWYCWDKAGNYMEDHSPFTVDGLPENMGIIDMCYDGTYFYGCGYSGNTLYKIHLELGAGSVEGTISLPINSYNVAYDPDADGGNGGFWIGMWSYHLTLIDKEGVDILDDISPPESMLGIAFDNTFEYGTYEPPFLWILTGTTTGVDGVIKCIHIASGDLLGIEFNAPNDPLNPDGIAGGLMLTYDYEPGTSTLIGCIQGEVNDYIFGYEISELEIPVYVDIVPGECPNRLNSNSRNRRVEVAICGGLGLNVNHIDPDSIKLERNGNTIDYLVPPGWDIVDIATPCLSSGYCDCHLLTGDGTDDLKVVFLASDIIDTLLGGSDGEYSLKITGKLKDEYGGTPIAGEDCLELFTPGGGG